MNEHSAQAEAIDLVEQSIFTCKSSWHAESALTCGRCNAVICPGCLVHAPGGTRCKPCANLRRPPMYEIGFQHYLRSSAIAIALAIPLGAMGAVVLPFGSMGFFGILIGFFAGSIIGSLLASAIIWGTKGKRGPMMQTVAIVGVGIILSTRFVLTGLPFELLYIDLIGWITGTMAACVAYQKLR